jgi:plastocyanin
MHRTMVRGAVVLMAAAALLSGCSSSSNNSVGSGGGGGGREFVSGDLAGNGASFSHVFTTAKSVPYYCRYHGGPGGVGMSGTITVTASTATPVKHSFSITAMTLPSTTINVMDTVVWTNNSGMVHTVESDH